MISIHAPREGCDASGSASRRGCRRFQSTHPARGATSKLYKEQRVCLAQFAYLHKGKKAEHTKQTRLCSMKLSFMLFGCEPAGEGVSSWTSHATKSKVRLEGRSAYSQSVRSSAHSDFQGNKSGGCPVRRSMIAQQLVPGGACTRAASSQTLKDGVLYALAVVDALPGDLPQAFAPGGILCIHIVGNQYQHR